MRNGTQELFDYVIVGAGSAGCVLADRLSADGKNRVLVLEYGGSDRSVFIQMPSALSIPMNMKRYNWMYESEPEPGLGGRRLHCPRGKVLGGSSSINGMVYMRGAPADFDRWQEEERAGLVLCRRAALFPPGRGAARGWRRVSRRGRTAGHPLRHAREPALQRLRGSGAAGWLSRHRRRQRLPAGRLRPDGHDGEGWRALVGGERLSEAGHEAGEPEGRDPCPASSACCSRGAARSASPGRAAARSTRCARRAR